MSGSQRSTLNPQRSRPNILWFCTDQQRFDTIGALGNPHVRTPHVDGLGAEGVAFTHAFAQSPVCTPSRAAMLTGRYPRTTRCRQNGQQIPADERLVTRTLAEAGYECGLAGKLHLSSCSGGRVEQRIDDGYSVFHWSHHPQPDWPENAYSQWLHQRGTSWEELYGGPSSRFVQRGVPAEFHQTTWCAEMAIEFIRERAGSRGSSGSNDSKNRPWLFSVNCFDPHHPFDPPGEFLERYDVAAMPLPKHRPGELDTKPRFQQFDHQHVHNDPGSYPTAEMTPDEAREVVAAYYAMIELIDEQFGRILAALDETGQREDTLVIFMSDHGEMLGDHGLLLKGPHFYDEAVRVPLVMSWPGRFQAGLRSDALVELIDLAPTLLEAAGLPVSPGIQGRPLGGILSGAADPSTHRDSVYSEYYNAWTHRGAYGTMLRTRDEKIVVYHGAQGGTTGELYDLRSDPDEFENLWDVPTEQSRKLRLMQQAFDRSVLTLDPLPPRLGPF